MSTASQPATVALENIIICRRCSGHGFWSRQSEGFAFEWLDQVDYLRVKERVWLVLIEKSTCTNPCLIYTELVICGRFYYTEALRIYEQPNCAAHDRPTRHAVITPVIGDVGASPTASGKEFEWDGAFVVFWQR
eukprot:GHVU01177791.1.p1 GENE.GHVU01177791.1~~GHVU01177791.1.p1  ORF type:complete len:134 (-),score=3.81 GHVU01177791.1:383-784(-)